MSRKTFFIIEDHTVTNIGLQQLVEQKTGAKCLGFAFSKDEAEEKLRLVDSSACDLTLPDIIILNLFLGNDSGFDLLKKLHKKYPSAKVLVYSMYSKPGILTLVLEEGAHGFVEKSAPRKCFNSCCKKYFERRNFCSAESCISAFYV